MVSMDQCVEWQGAKDEDGYGQFTIVCCNPACVNPEHLEVVTDRVNILRGTGTAARNARKTHCKRGHPLSGDNLIVEKSRKRQCHKCCLLRKHRHRGTLTEAEVRELEEGATSGKA